MRRRAVLGVGLAATAATLSGCGERSPRAVWGAPASSSATPSAAPSSAAPSVPPSVPAAPSSNPLAARLTGTMRRFLVPTPQNPAHPTYAGAVVLVAVNGTTTVHAAVGDALRYKAGPVELPASARVAMRTDSVFDLASVTKVFTSIVALQQVDKGRISLAAPVVDYLPGFMGTGKSAVTVAMLMAHTGGLPVGLPSATWDAVLTCPLVPGAVPGTVFRYSSTGLLLLGRIVEKVTGLPLDQAVRAGITGPLGLRDTGYTPMAWMSSADRAARLVATDARSSRSLLRGVVHDDVAYALGGVCGHAGLFSTAADLAVIGQLLLDGGVYRGIRILSEATARHMLSNVNVGLTAVDAEHPGRSAEHGLGVELDQPWFMGRLATPATFGHTGFTGTSLLVEPRRRLVLVLLTNRAHPNWSWADPNPARVAVADAVADAVR
jgi:CubicO group peptidase (beta-lactamase class C family)